MSRRTPDTLLLDAIAKSMFHAQMRNLYGDEDEQYHWTSVSEGRKQMYREMAEAALRVLGEDDEK